MPVKAHRASDYLKSPEDAAAYLNPALEERATTPACSLKALDSVGCGERARFRRDSYTPESGVDYLGAVHVERMSWAMEDAPVSREPLSFWNTVWAVGVNEADCR